MAQKIEVNEVAEILKRNDLEPALLRQIIEEINLAVQPDADDDEDGEKEPRQKNQFVIVVSDPENVIGGKDLTGWVVQIPESDSVSLVKEKLHRAMYEFNTTKKGRMMPVKTIGDGIENVKRGLFKEQGIAIKTKTPVFVVVTDNILPTEVKSNS
jgi:hypothetical protein